MAKLYEIDEAILACIDQETGEILDEEALQELQLEREAKVEAVALWYKNTLSDAEQYKQEKNAFAEKERKARDLAERLKNWLDYALSGQKFKTTRVAISYRKSEQLIVDDVYKIDDEFLRYKEPEPDKTKLKEAIKNGATFEGVRLEEKQNISIR